MIIAIDGPAASGKGSLASRLAEHFGFVHLDTGKIYRAVGLAVIRAGGDPQDEEVAIAAANGIDPSDIADPELSGETAAAAAAHVSAMAPVRQILRDYQRNFAASPPGNALGAVIEGRDIGTVICPDADIKIYIDARPEVRAERRHKELLKSDPTVIYGDVLREMENRDRLDTQRVVNPLRVAEDASVLDTSDMDAETAFREALKRIAHLA